MSKLRGWVPGSLLLRPAALLAALLILVNDAWLKLEHPGWWSGKLSDFGICVLLPMMIFAAAEWGAWLGSKIRRLPRPGARIWTGSCLGAAVYFTAMQLSPAFGQAHARFVAQVVPGRGVLAVVADPTDLIALVMIAWVWIRGPGSRAFAGRGQPWRNKSHAIMAESN